MKKRTAVRERETVYSGEIILVTRPRVIVAPKACSCGGTPNEQRLNDAEMTAMLGARLLQALHTLRGTVHPHRITCSRCGNFVQCTTRCEAVRRWNGAS